MQHTVRFILSLAVVLTVFAFTGPSEASASVKRGAVKLNGRMSVRADGCKLKFGLKSTSAVTRIKCTGTGRVRGGRSARGVVFLRLKDSVVLTGRGCFFLKVKNTQSRIDLLCQAQDPDATPTPSPTPTITPTPNANALAAGHLTVVNNIYSISTGNPGGSYGSVEVSGIDKLLVALDRRPQNGMLYALGYDTSAFTVQLYAVSSDTGATTAVGSTGTFVASDGTTPVQIGSGTSTLFDIDFDPVSDRLRVVTSTGQNFRIDPNTGAFVDGDLGGSGGSVPGLNMDGDIQGNVSTVQGAAYTNNQSNASVTTLYTLDSAGDKLCRQSPPNIGTQVCGPLAEALDSVVGFDILPGVNTTSSDFAVNSGSGYSIVKTAGSAVQRLAKIDLVNGAVSDLSVIGVNLLPLTSLSVMTAGDSMIAMSSAGDSLLRFSSGAPGTVTTVAVTGVTAGETLTGLDFRPSTGQLFTLGINAGADTGTLYRIDPQTGAATAVGSAGLIALVDSSSSTIDLPAVSSGYGLNFNPVVDRIRVVTGTGLNFRINPSTGAVVDGDPVSPGSQPDSNLSGVTTTAHGAAYTNASAGQTVTTLYTLDGVSNALYIQMPPNAGIQTGPVPLMLGGSALDFAPVNGFNISPDVRITTSDTPSTGSAFAALTVGGVTSLYTVNLSSGAASNIGAIGTGATAVSGLAVSQRAVK